MARQIWVSRQEAELIVEVLDNNYDKTEIQPAGLGSNFADELRVEFGMISREQELANSKES